MIDITKTYKTRDGREVRIYAVDGALPYPIQGAIRFATWDLFSWSGTGMTARGGVETPLDLIEKPKTVSVDLWINAYADSTCSLHWSEEAAASKVYPQALRIACVHIERDVTIGEGL